ncbi:MAG: hypothetical protein GY701_31500 [Sulfitobacter sp.]|nr:hypothetical protein [Sulfitobacter sp.]
MADFDQFFLDLGYQRAGESPRSKCREELFNMSWVTPSGVLVYVSYLTGRDVHYLVVPYSYEGLAPVPDKLGWIPSCGASPDA